MKKKSFILNNSKVNKILNIYIYRRGAVFFFILLVESKLGFSLSFIRCKSSVRQTLNQR